jgi:tRNA U34 2-thiouridine synthase MnmA/TrmU
MLRKAIALLSGGLDSALAARLILDQDIDVVGIRFLTDFGCGTEDTGCGHDTSGLAKSLGIQIKLCHMGLPYAQMVRNPKHGWGKNMNPCVDCRIMMLKWAKEYMEIDGAGFIVTGEVLGQRPMSQRRQTLKLIDTEAGLKGLVLRPLSAKLLEPTKPEIQGIVERGKLLDIHGRSRRRQYELAAKYRLQGFGQPAGGCLLTDPTYSKRLRDLFIHTQEPLVTQINLLRVGRHFRFNHGCKIIVGRNKAENKTIESLAQHGDYLLELKDYMGPTTLVCGTNVTKEAIQFAVNLTCRYGDVPEYGDVVIKRLIKPGIFAEFSLLGFKIPDDVISAYRIG